MRIQRALLVVILALIWLDTQAFAATPAKPSEESQDNPPSEREQTAQEIMLMLDKLDVEKTKQLFHEDFTFEDKTAPFKWSREQALSYFAGRRKAGVADNRRIEVDKTYFVNDEVFIFHTRWVGMICGTKRNVNICTAIIMQEGKILHWTDHADMEGFR